MKEKQDFYVLQCKPMTGQSSKESTQSRCSLAQEGLHPGQRKTLFTYSYGASIIYHPLLIFMFQRHWDLLPTGHSRPHYHGDVGEQLFWGDCPQSCGDQRMLWETPIFLVWWHQHLMTSASSSWKDISCKSEKGHMSSARFRRVFTYVYTNFFILRKTLQLTINASFQLYLFEFISLYLVFLLYIFYTLEGHQSAPSSRLSLSLSLSLLPPYAPLASPQQRTSHPRLKKRRWWCQHLLFFSFLKHHYDMNSILYHFLDLRKFSVPDFFLYCKQSSLQLFIKFVPFNLHFILTPIESEPTITHDSKLFVLEGFAML